ncbi:MAG: ankyrin repeat domain-containing protein [Synergistaceae bacterium]|nr:ankyrin repeat domain-containing protein [Synergistaceae bacterium]
MSEAVSLLKGLFEADEWEKIEAQINDETDINALDDDGYSLLSYAVMSNNPENVKKILELGADVNIKLGVKFNVLGYVALLFAVNEQVNKRVNDVNHEIVSILIQAGADMSDAMLIGIRAGSLEFVDLLFQNGADINGKFAEEQTPFAIAILGMKSEVKPDVIKYLVEHGANLNEIFDLGDNVITTALNICITMGRIDLMRILLEHGADPNIKDNRGRVPLLLAVLLGDIDSEDISCLLDAGADVNARDDKGMTALMWAIIERDKSADFLISALIRTGGIQTENGEKFAGFCYALSALKRENQLEVVNLLVERGADIKLRAKNGMNALSCAAMNFDDEIMSILKGAGKNNKS